MSDKAPEFVGVEQTFPNPFPDSKGRWYFHDESFVSWGPFEDEELAKRMFGLYGKILEGGPTALTPIEFLEYYARCCMRGQTSPVFQARMMEVLEYVSHAKEMSNRIHSDLNESIGVIGATLNLHSIVLKQVFAALSPGDLQVRVGEVIQASFVDANKKAGWIEKVISDYVEFVNIGKRLHPYEKCAHLVGGFIYNDLENKGREERDEFLHFWVHGMWAELDAHYPEWKAACDKELAGGK